MWQLIREIFTFEPLDPGTDIASALSYLNRVVKRHAIVFLISDCLDDGFEKAMRFSAKKHDLTVIRISDIAERMLPDAGILTLHDPETGERATINTSNKGLRRAWHEDMEERNDRFVSLLKGMGVDLVDLDTGSDVVEPLGRLFERRKRRINV